MSESVTIGILILIACIVVAQPEYAGQTVHMCVLLFAVIVAAAGLEPRDANEGNGNTATAPPTHETPAPVELTSDPTSWKTETECRRVFETLYGLPFRKIRPAWLKNPRTGRNLELDGFNADVPNGLVLDDKQSARGVAFEYNGKEHYEFCPRFHRSAADVEYQKEKDALKVRRCKDMNVLLVVIPYTVRFAAIEAYVRSVLVNAGCTVP
jgi:hypothetical protein